MARVIFYYENGRLPLGEIMSAFPDEIGEIVPSVIRRLEDELRPYEEARTMKAYYAMTAGLPGWFANKLGDAEIPKDRMRLLKDSRWLMKSNRIEGIGGKPNRRAVLPVEIVKQIPIVELHAFQNLKKIRNKYMASCPLGHEDKTPSFLIDDKNNFYCFSCHAKGDGIEFIKKLHNLDFVSAVKYMQGLKQ